MAKELPYFRFTASEWLNDNISLESYELKGLFIDICAFYWFKDCSINIALLNKRFSDAKELIHELRELEIITFNNNNSITIKFLDEQFDLLSEKRKKRSEAGRVGGLKKSSNAKAMLKQKPSYKDKDKDKDKDKYKDNKKEVFTFDEFWKLYPKKTNKQGCIKKYKTLNDEEKQKIKDTLQNFIQYRPFPSYTHPDPSTYLNQGRWDDELPAPIIDVTESINKWGELVDSQKSEVYNLILKIPKRERSQRESHIVSIYEPC
jgi:hypothetical protein